MFLKANNPNKTRKILILVLVVGAIVTSFLGYRYYENYQPRSLKDGINELKGGNYAVAREKIKPFADSGDAEAQYFLGMIYAYGLDTQADFSEAEKWYRLSTSNDSELAGCAYYTAIEYLDEGGLAPIDKTKAKYWLQLAAKLGRYEAPILLNLLSEQQ